MAPTNADGWGIYRVVFKKGTKGDEYSESTPPRVDFKYCLRSTPGEDFMKNNVLVTNPMGEHIRNILQILNPIKIADQYGEPLEID